LKINIVRASAFSERGKAFGRLDAEFVDSEMLDIENHLRLHQNSTPLKLLGLSKIDSYNPPGESGSATAAYIAIDNIDAQDGFLFHQTLADDELPTRAKYLLNANDIVISNVRPERGAVGIVLQVQDNAIGSSGLTVVRVNEEAARNVLFAFLRSRFARAQLIRRSRGSMYPAITKDDVPEILVPNLPLTLQEDISKAVKTSLAHRAVFFDLYKAQTKNVESFLSDSLGQPPPDIVLDVASVLPVRIAKRSELFEDGANRFDAEFHRKEYVEFEARLRSLNDVVRLGTTFEAFAGGNPGKGDATIYRLRQAQLSGFGISYSGCEEVEGATAPTKMTLHHADVLIACTAHEPHYVGRRVDLIDDLLLPFRNKILPVPDVMIIRARKSASKPTPAFLASFLRTKWGRRQFQRLNRGVRGGHVYGQDVENFIFVPKPPAVWMSEFEKTQDAIREARRASISAMAAAVELIEAALSAEFPMLTLT
jgi:hypothetical protein